MIDEVQQSSSEKGRLANKIYLGELVHVTAPVLNSNEPGLKKTLGGDEKKTGLVLNSATSETEYSETEYSETKTVNSFRDDEEEAKNQLDDIENKDMLKRKVEQVTKYDKEYIWALVHGQLRKEGLSEINSDYAMIYFEERYLYALEHMRFAKSSESIAEYVFNGVLSEWNKQLRRRE